MRWFNRGLACLLVVYIALIAYTNRAIFSSKFDVTYWQDKFEHSQWSLPLSVRTIGDDGLYLWVGYRLIQGADPTRINAEAPPLGKYLIGASIKIFGNGYIYGFLSTSTLLLLCYILTTKLLKNRFLSLATTAIIATDPLITSQFSLTMLDSIQAVCLLLLLLFSLDVDKKKSVSWYPVFMGIALGLFAETKFPIFAPFIGVVFAAYIWIKYKHILPVIWFSVGTGVGYLIPYIPYFLMGHSLSEWIQVQRWIISFYRDARLTATWGSALVNLLTGQYQNIFSRTWSAASHWSPTWTGITFTAGIGIYQTIKNKDSKWSMVAILVFIILGIYLCIPFWTRYLVLLLPLLYMMTAFVLSHTTRKIQLVLITVLLCGNIASGITTLFPTPEATARQVVYNWEHMFFRDMYEDITRASQSKWTSDEFRTFALKTFSDGQIESVGIKVVSPSWKPFISGQTMRVIVTYYTRNLGPFSEEHDVRFVNEDGRWKIPWDWSIMLSDLQTNRRLVTSVNTAKRGAILGSDRKPMAEDVSNDMIWITTKEISPSEEPVLLKYLEGLFEGKIAAVYFHQRLYGNTLVTNSTPVGIPPLPLTPLQRSTLSGFSGVRLTPMYGRRNYGSAIINVGEVTNTQYMECCSRLYSTTTYDGQTGAEKKYNTLLKGINGGTLILINTDGSPVRTLLRIEKKEGQDVQA